MPKLYNALRSNPGIRDDFIVAELVLFGISGRGAGDVEVSGCRRQLPSSYRFWLQLQYYKGLHSHLNHLIFSEVDDTIAVLGYWGCGTIIWVTSKYI